MSFSTLRLPNYYRNCVLNVAVSFLRLMDIRRTCEKQCGTCVACRLFCLINGGIVDYRKLVRDIYFEHEIDLDEDVVDLDNDQSFHDFSEKLLRKMNINENVFVKVMKSWQCDCSSEKVSRMRTNEFVCNFFEGSINDIMKESGGSGLSCENCSQMNFSRRRIVSCGDCVLLTIAR